MTRLLVWLILVVSSFSCQGAEAPHLSPVTLFVKEIGLYEDTWVAVPAEGIDMRSASYLTVIRAGKSGDYLVNVVIDCRGGKYYFGTGIEYGHIIVPQENVSAAVPKEALKRARELFCK